MSARERYAARYLALGFEIPTDNETFIAQSEWFYAHSAPAAPRQRPAFQCP